MEVDEPVSILLSTPGSLDADVHDKDANEDELVNLKETIEVENSSLKATPNENADITSAHENTVDNGKKKIKEEKPPTKIVVRRLPPTMTRDHFLEQVSPLPEIDYMYYVQGDVYNTVNPYSRAYLNFVHQDDLFSFSRTFDNYVFLDAKGQEYPAIVEFAMFQRVPKQRLKKKDPVIGTIESDPSFIGFKENLLAEALESSKTGGKALKQHYFETEISTTEEVNTTPLLEYLKTRRAEKARIREERREEKKRKEIERKLKQKSKDKKGEGDEEESPKDMRVFSSKERRDMKEKENRTIKKKDEKDKPRETRAREFKSRGGKSYQEERLKLAERREEQKKKELVNSEKRLEASETTDVPESLEASDQSKNDEKVIKIEKRKYDSRRGAKYDDDWKDEKKRNRNEKNHLKLEGRDKKDDYSRRSDRKSDMDLRRKSKTSRNHESSKAEKRRASVAQEEDNKCSAEVTEQKEDTDAPLKKVKSCDDIRLVSILENDKPTDPSVSESMCKGKKRCSSLENIRSRNIVRGLSEVDTIILDKKGKSYKDTKSSENTYCYRSRKDLSTRKNYSDIKKPSFKKKERYDDKTEDNRDCKNHDEKAEGDNKETNKKDPPRSERRIRNKDRPSIEIYRPGMGKFSKQRLEKEKALGSSTEIESPSHSPSPTPKSKLIS